MISKQEKAVIGVVCWVILFYIVIEQAITRQAFADGSILHALIFMFTFFPGVWCLPALVEVLSKRLDKDVEKRRKQREAEGGERLDKGISVVVEKDSSVPDVPAVTLVQTALHELNDLVRSENYGAISFWAEKNAWVKRHNTLNEGLDKVINIARKAYEIRDLGLEGEVKHKNLQADLLDAELRLEKAARDLDLFKNPPTPPPQQLKKPKITKRERIVALTSEAIENRNSAKKIREKLKMAGVTDPEEQDTIIDDILYKIKIEEEKHL